MPPSSISVIPVEDIYTTGGDTVTLECTVITNVPDPRNLVNIRWRSNTNDVIDIVEVPPTPVNDMYSINYTYPLTINNISLSEAGKYTCISRINSKEIKYVRFSRRRTKVSTVIITSQLPP